MKSHDASYCDLSQLNPEGIRNALARRTILLPVSIELPSNGATSLLSEGFPTGNLGDRPNYRRLAMRVRSEDVQFVRLIRRSAKAGHGDTSLE